MGIVDTIQTQLKLWKFEKSASAGVSPDNVGQFVQQYDGLQYSLRKDELSSAVQRYAQKLLDQQRPDLFVQLHSALGSHNKARDALSPLVNPCAQQLIAQNDTDQFLALEKSTSLGDPASRDALSPLIYDYSRKLLDQDKLEDFIKLCDRSTGRHDEAEMTVSLMREGGQRMLDQKQYETFNRLISITDDGEQYHEALAPLTAACGQDLLQQEKYHEFVKLSSHVLGKQPMTQALTPMVADCGQALIAQQKWASFIDLRENTRWHPESQNALSPLIAACGAGILQDSFEDNRPDFVRLREVVKGNEADEDALSPLVIEAAQQFLDWDSPQWFGALHDAVDRNPRDKAALDKLATVVTIPDMDGADGEDQSLRVLFRHEAQDGRLDVSCQRRSVAPSMLMQQWDGAASSASETLSAKLLQQKLETTLRTVAQTQSPAAPAAQRALKNLQR